LELLGLDAERRDPIWGSELIVIEYRSRRAIRDDGADSRPLSSRAESKEPARAWPARMADL